MILLRCLICKSEVDIISNLRSINKKIKCRSCGFTNSNVEKFPEIIVLKKRNFNGKNS